MKIYNNSVKEKIIGRELVVGGWIAMDHPWVADIMSQCGFEFIVIELEHSVVELGALTSLFAIIELHNVVPMARLSSNDPVQAKRVLEAGAYGLIFPMVNTAEEAKRAVNSVKYPPLGERPFGLGRAQDFGFSSQRYFEKANDETIVIIQVEHIKGVENIDDILKVEGIDGIFIGPYDLSGSLGVPGQLNHEVVVKARKKVLQACISQNIPAGIHVLHPDKKLYNEVVKEGFKIIAYGGDIIFLGEYCKKCLQDIEIGNINNI